MDKVKITQELANAIEAVKTKGMYDNKNFEILEMAINSPHDDDPMLEEHKIIYLFCHHDGINILIQALANDYEVEETPEDKVRANFEYALEQIEKHDGGHGNDQEAEHWKGMKTGIIVTLATLNIKIVGVNHE